jgi:hypothetical protein
LAGNASKENPSFSKTPQRKHKKQKIKNKHTTSALTMNLKSIKRKEKLLLIRKKNYYFYV